MDEDGVVDRNERVVLARRADWSMVGFQWTGEEPEGLEAVGLAEALGAQWEGDELVTYDLPLLIYNFRHWELEYLEDSD